MIKKKTITGICVVLMLLSIGGSQAMIDLTGTQTGTGGGGFSGKYTDLDFAGTTGLSDAIDNESSGGGGNPFDQDLNTTDDVKFDGIAMGYITNPQARIHIDSDGISTPLNSNGVMIASDGNDVFYETISVDSTEGLVMHGDGSCMSGLVHNEYGFNWFKDYEDEALILFTQCQKPIIFKTNNMTRMTIDENGDIIFNNTLTLDNMTISNWTDISSSGGNPFNQSLNTTDVVNFTGLNIAKNSYPIITVIGEVEDAGGRIELGDGNQNDYLTLSGDNADGIGVWVKGEELILGAMSVGRGISFYTNGTDVGHWMSNGYLGIGETNTDNINNRLRVVGNVNATGNVTASKFNTPLGIGWTGWIDNGTNVNCTYSGGILIAVSATSGSAGYNETG